MAQHTPLNKNHPYKNAIGIRVAVAPFLLGTLNKEAGAGQAIGHTMIAASYKRFFTRKSAFEINAGVGSFVIREQQYRKETYYYNGKDTTIYIPGSPSYKRAYPGDITLSYTLNVPIVPRGLRWVIGAGVIVNTLRPEYQPDPGTTNSFSRVYKRGINFGGGGIGALDYKFKNIPVNITIDNRMFLFVKDFSGGFFNIGLAARYTF